MSKWTKKPGLIMALVAGLVSVALIAAACGGDDEVDAPAAVNTPLPAAAAAAPPPGAAAPPPPPGAAAAPKAPAPAAAAAAAAAAPTAAPKAAVAAPVAAARSTATAVPRALTGIIPGSKLTIATGALGTTACASKAVPYKKSAPNSNPTKDAFMLLDQSGSLLPHAIADWDISADLKDWSLTMRDDIYFWAFDRFADVEDLRWSLYDGNWTGRFAGSPRGREFVASESTILGDYTLGIQFELNPWGSPHKHMTDVTARWGGMMPSKEILEMGNQDVATGYGEFLCTDPGPYNSGGYTYVRQIGDELVDYEANPNWWHDPVVDFERMSMIHIPESATRLALLATEAADIAVISIPLLHQVDKMEHIRVLVQPHSVVLPWYFLNMWEEGHPAREDAFSANNPFLDVRVREAFNIGVDRDEIIEVLYKGLAERDDAPNAWGNTYMWDHPTVLEMRNNPIPFDPERARQLLQEADFDFDMKIPAAMFSSVSSFTPELQDTLEAAVSQWIGNLGVKVEFIITGTGFYGDLIAGKTVPYYLWGSERSSAVAKETMIHAQYFGPASVNFANTHWDPINEMRERGFACATLACFTQAGADISKFLRDNWLTIPMFITPVMFGVDKEKIESWPVVSGPLREHYMQFIRATEGYRNALSK